MGAYARFILRGPDVRLAGIQFRKRLDQTIKEIAHAVEAEVVELTPIDSSNLMNAWDVSFGRSPSGGLVGYIVNAVEYIWYVLKGTGIYGPYGQVIKPVTAQALRFEIGGEVLFRRSVKGQRPNDFVAEAIENVKPEIERIVARLFNDWYKPGSIS